MIDSQGWTLKHLLILNQAGVFLFVLFSNDGWVICINCGTEMQYYWFYSACCIIIRRLTWHGCDMTTVSEAKSSGKEWRGKCIFHDLQPQPKFETPCFRFKRRRAGQNNSTASAWKTKLPTHMTIFLLTDLKTNLHWCIYCAKPQCLMSHPAAVDTGRYL